MFWKSIIVKNNIGFYTAVTLTIFPDQGAEITTIAFGFTGSVPANPFRNARIPSHSSGGFHSIKKHVPHLSGINQVGTQQLIFYYFLTSFITLKDFFNQHFA